MTLLPCAICGMFIRYFVCISEVSRLVHRSDLAAWDIKGIQTVPKDRYLVQSQLIYNT